VKKRLLPIFGIAWTRDLTIFVLAMFLIRCGEGVLSGARANFFVETLGLNNSQVLGLEGIRELPGLALMFLAALTMHLPLSQRAVASVLIEGVGYGLQATVTSYTGLVAVALTASLGLHGYQPVNPALSLALSTKSNSGRVMGTIASVGALAAIAGMGLIAATSRLFEALSLRAYYIAGGLLIILAGLLLTKLPKTLGSTREEQPRLLLRKRYWLYYVLTFFEGCRKQVLGTFGTLILVQRYTWKVSDISLLLLVSGIINLVSGPALGYLVDRFGEKPVLAAAYVGLTLCCVGFATIANPFILGAILIVIKLLLILNLGLPTYVNRIAPPEELTPTLSAGVSINHVSSVAMPLISAALLPVIGYSGVFLMTGALVALTIPFALAMQIEPPKRLAIPAPTAPGE